MRARIWILAALYVITSLVLVIGVWLALEEQQVLQARYHRLHLDELLSIRENIARTGRDPEQAVAPAEAVAPTLVPFLPPQNGKHEIGRGALIDPTGGERYVWGLEDSVSDLHPLISVPLLPPFEQWELRYSMPKEFWTRRLYGSALLTLVPSTLLAFLLLLPLSRFLTSIHRRELEDAAQRVNFVNQVSHELKTPLTNIRMYAELLSERLSDEGAEDERSYMRIILAESERLSRLITNVLTFGRRERKEQPQLHKRVAVPAQLVEEVLRDFSPRFEKAGIDVEARLFDRTPVGFDHDALKQILFNLISNVEKYAASGKHIALTLCRFGEKIVIDVVDRGPGISKSAREQIFEPFFRDSDSMLEGTSGSGLGLTICRELARLHGGDVELVECERGACFRVSLQVEIQIRTEVMYESAGM